MQRLQQQKWYTFDTTRILRKGSCIAKEQRNGKMIEAKKNERTNALKKVTRLCKEFGFTAGMLKGSLAEGRRKS